MGPSTVDTVEPASPEPANPVRPTACRPVGCDRFLGGGRQPPRLRCHSLHSAWQLQLGVWGGHAGRGGGGLAIGRLVVDLGVGGVALDCLHPFEGAALAGVGLAGGHQLAILGLDPEAVPLIAVPNYHEPSRHRMLLVVLVMSSLIADGIPPPAASLAEPVLRVA